VSIEGTAARDAGLLRRLAALALDVVLLGLGLAAVAVLLWKSGGAGVLQTQGLAPGSSGVRGVWGPTVALTCVAVAAAWRLLGGTPGALLLGAVVCRRGERPGWPRSMLRLMLALATGGIGLLWCLGGRPALHDRLSGTRLLIEDEALARPQWGGRGGAATPW
jgi:hypothetical protein